MVDWSKLVRNKGRHRGSRRIWSSRCRVLGLRIWGSNINWNNWALQIIITANLMRRRDRHNLQLGHILHIFQTVRMCRRKNQGLVFPKIYLKQRPKTWSKISLKPKWNQNWVQVKLTNILRKVITISKAKNIDITASTRHHWLKTLTKAKEHHFKINQ